jgi:hypothetical protein
VFAVSDRSLVYIDGDDNKPVAQINYGEISKTVIVKPWTDPTDDPLNDLRQCMRAVSANCGFQADLIVLGYPTQAPERDRFLWGTILGTYRHLDKVRFWAAY